MLIYYLNKDNHDVKFANFINEENPTGRYWVNAYIDNYKERVAYIDEYKEQVFQF
jgi:hypothetical protein